VLRGPLPLGQMETWWVQSEAMKSNLFHTELWGGGAELDGDQETLFFVVVQAFNLSDHRLMRNSEPIR